MAMKRRKKFNPYGDGQCKHCGQFLTDHIRIGIDYLCRIRSLTAWVKFEAEEEAYERERYHRY